MFRALAFVFAVLPAFAQAQCNGPSFWEGLSAAEQSELTARGGATPYGAGNIWLATKDDTVLTIIGTMHLPDPRHDAAFARVLPALEQGDLLLVEATLEDQAAMQTHMARNPDLMTLPDGSSLPDLLDPDTWAAIRVAAAARGLPGFMVAKMQPWFLSLTLAIPPCAMASMVAGDAGLDNMLMQAAIARDIPVAALEPWQDMFDLLTMGTFDEQVDALRLSLVDPALQDSLVVALVDLYFSEQSAMGWYIAQYTKDFLPPEAIPMFDDQMAQLEQLLLVDRNADWIPVIETAAAQNDTVVIAFGAAHLFGDSGVLRLLENRSWEISPF